MTDPHDPLRGLDPYPRERIEGLHRERAELLEEIVSTPGPGKQPASMPSKVLLAVGVAAALVIVGGGGWLLGNAGGDSDSSGDQVAAVASQAPSTTVSSSAPTASMTSASPSARTRGVKVLGGTHECSRIRVATLDRILRLQSRHMQGLSTKGRYYIVLRRNGCVIQTGLPPHHR